MTIITHSPHPFQVWKNNLQLQYLLFVKLFCQLQYLLFAWHPIGTRGVSSFPRLPLPQRRRREVPRRRDWPTVRGGSCDIACLRGADGHVERSPLKKGAGFFGSDELGKNEDENYTSVKCLIQVRGGELFVSWLEEMAAFELQHVFKKDIAKQPNSQARPSRRPSRGPQSFGPLVPSNWRMRGPLSGWDWPCFFATENNHCMWSWINILGRLDGSLGQQLPTSFFKWNANGYSLSTMILNRKRKERNTMENEMN